MPTNNNGRNDPHEHARYEDGWSGEDRREKHWQITREISVGNILTMVSLAGVLIGGYVSMDRRVTVIEARQEQQQRLDIVQDMTTRDGLARIETKLNDLESFLRGHNGNGK